MKYLPKQFSLFLVLFFIATTLYPAIASQKNSNGISAVIIGVPLPLSGELKEFGIMLKNSFEMAKDSINENDGIHGRPLNVQYFDSQGKTSLGAEIVKKLVVDFKAIMLVGGYASSPTYYMAKTAEKLDIPFLITTASADKITQKSWKNIYRLNPPISEYTKGLEDFWIKIYKPQSMAIVYENSMFGTSGATRMMGFCRDQAIEIRALIGYDRSKASPAYFRSLLAPLTVETPEVIYMISYLEDGVLLVKKIRKLKIKSLLCGDAGGFTLQEFIKRADSSANHLLTATLWSEHLSYPGAKEYYLRYVKRYASQPDYHGVEAYSGLLVAADALKRAKSFKPEDIRTSLNQTFMMSPFGPVKFYSYKNFERQNSVRTLVLQIVNGKFETIWPPDLSTFQFVPDTK